MHARSSPTLVLHTLTLRYLVNVHIRYITIKRFNWPQLTSIGLQWPPMTSSCLQRPPTASNDLQWPPMTSNDLQWPQIEQTRIFVYESYMYVYLVLKSSSSRGQYNNLGWREELLAFLQKCEINTWPSAFHPSKSVDKVEWKFAYTWIIMTMYWCKRFSQHWTKKFSLHYCIIGWALLCL